MYSWLAWIGTAAVAVTLGAVGYHFSLRTLRWVALTIALAAAAYLTVYGLTHPGQKPGSLSDEFARSADTLSTALIRPFSLGHNVPAPGQIGRLAIVVLLVLGYRALEVWALRRQAPCLDTSALTSDRQDNAADAATNTQTGKQRHDWLAAELKFRLPSVEVRSPAILPGGSRPSGLASIAEATGVNGAGLAGAIIRFFGMIWPSPPKIQVRAWVEQTPGLVGSDGATRVTVSLADPRSGASIATKTLAAGSLDDAAAAVAGYVARHIFARDRTVPPWSVSATDGADLAALLRARQVRAYPECRSGIRDAWKRQIEILEAVAHGNLCAGVVRYELAQLYDLTGRHVEALLLHAANREQYPRFYRGRYRLAMSLEMLTNPDSGLAETDPATLKKVRRILGLCSPATERRQPSRRRPDWPAGRPGTQPASCRMAGTARDRALPDVAAHHLGSVPVPERTLGPQTVPAATAPAGLSRRCARRAAASGCAPGAAGRSRGPEQIASRQDDRPDHGGNLRRQQRLRRGVARIPAQSSEESAAGPRTAAYPSPARAVQHSILASRV